MVKDTDEQPGEGMWEGHRTSTSFPGASLSQLLQVFTDLEALQSLSFWGFYGGFII